MTIRSGGRPRDGRADAGPPVRSRRLRDRDRSPSSPSPSRAAAAAAAGGAGSGLVGLAQVPDLRARPGGDRPGRRADRAPAGRQRARSWASPRTTRPPSSCRSSRTSSRENLGTALTTPASTDPTQVEFLVEPGDTATTIATRLEDAGPPRATAARSSSSRSTGTLTGALQQGTFILRKNMTPDQLVSALLAPPDGPVRRHRPADRPAPRADHGQARDADRAPDGRLPSSTTSSSRRRPRSSPTIPWLKTILTDAPKGASLEGFLWPATYRVLPDTTPEELVRLMLDKFVANVGPDRLAVPKDARPDLLPGPDPGLDRRARGACSTRRSRSSPASTRTGSTPRSGRSACSTRTRRSSTSTTRSSSPSSRSTTGRRTSFWAPIKGGLTDETLPADLAGYNTYTSTGLPPGPIATPTLTSIDAALEPDTKDGYLYFVANADGSGTTRVRQDAQGAPGERQEVPQADEPRRAGRGWPVPADFAAPPSAADLDALGRGRSGRPARPGSRASGRGSRRPASTPTSASGASTCAT